MGVFDSLKKLFKRKSQLELLQAEEKNESETVESDVETQKIENDAKEIEREFYSYEQVIDKNFVYGYILKTLKSIEESLKRIEYNMITKDWASLNLTEKKDLENLINKLNEKIEYTRILLPASSALSRSSNRLNEIIRKAAEIIRSRKEISYEDLAKELGISSSYLRAIANLIEINNNDIKRIIKDKKGFFVCDFSNTGEKDKNATA
ncbi:MAG: hypothetical protein QXT34_02535 [Candidatus Aenigmatarchaeota archaeon]